VAAYDATTGVIDEATGQTSTVAVGDGPTTCSYQPERTVVWEVRAGR
jgi:hypothetical protein